LSPNGKLLKFWTTAREASKSPQITSIKKGIIEAFQTKLNGIQRVEETQKGDVLVHYGQKVIEDGSVVVEAINTNRDLLRAGDKNQRRKDSKTKGKKYNFIRDGVQMKIFQTTSDVVGKHKKNKKRKNRTKSRFWNISKLVS